MSGRFAEYKLDFFWWEEMEVLRRFVLIGLMSVIYPGTIVQLVIANLISLSYLVVQVQAAPFLR